MRTYLFAGLVSGFTLLLSISLSAQNLTQAGVKLGLNVATLRTGAIEDLNLSSKSGLVIGGFLALKVGGNLTLQPELLYSQKGVRISDSFQDVNVDTRLKINYLEAPLLVRFTVPAQGKFKPSFFAGPAIAAKLTSKIKSEAMGISAEENLDTVKSFDVGFVFGGGVDFDFGSGQLLFDGRYTLGLTNIDDTGANENTKNGAFSLLVGYAFPIGRTR